MMYKPYWCEHEWYVNSDYGRIWEFHYAFRDLCRENDIAETDFIIQTMRGETRVLMNMGEML